MYCSVPINDNRALLSAFKNKAGAKSPSATPAASRSASAAPTPAASRSASVVLATETTATTDATLAAPARPGLGSRTSSAFSQVFSRRESNFKAFRDWEY